jgi:hypothetical protein
MYKYKISIFVFLIAFIFISCSKKIVEKAETNKTSYYTCPMHSEIFQTKPGHCPKCLMELVQWDPNNKRQQTYDSGHSGHSGHSGSGGGGGCH